MDPGLNSGLTLGLNDSNIQIFFHQLRKRGLKGSMGEKEINFARKVLEEPTMTWNYSFIPLLICLYQ